MLFSTAFTVEVEDPLFVGLHDNTSGVAALFLGFGVLLLFAGTAVGMRASGRGRIAVATVAVTLLLFGVFRAAVLAPMLSCDGSRIAQQADGSYTCVDG